MNQYFYKVWLPLQLLTIIGFFLAIIDQITLNWITIIISWALLGIVGTGVGQHRLFSHRQFETWKPVEYIIAILGTFAAYAPILFWVGHHQYHHKVADTRDDPSSPALHGFWESFLWWRMRSTIVTKIYLKNVPAIMVLRDPFLMFLSKHFTIILYSYAIVLFLIDPVWLFNLFIIPVFIEHIRINIISSLSHMKLPFSYKNFKSNDKSWNNIIIGYLTLGFGWHNNHHSQPRMLSNHVKWWEIDIEGYIGKLLSKRKKI